MFAVHFEEADLQSSLTHQISLTAFHFILTLMLGCLVNKRVENGKSSVLWGFCRTQGESALIPEGTTSSLAPLVGNFG